MKGLLLAGLVTLSVSSFLFADEQEKSECPAGFCLKDGNCIPCDPAETQNNEQDSPNSSKENSEVDTSN